MRWPIASLQAVSQIHSSQASSTAETHTRNARPLTATSNFLPIRGPPTIERGTCSSGCQFRTQICYSALPPRGACIVASARSRSVRVQLPIIQRPEEMAMDSTQDWRSSVEVDDDTFQQSLARLSQQIAARRSAILVPEALPPAPREWKAWPLLLLIAVAGAATAGYHYA